MFVTIFAIVLSLGFVGIAGADLLDDNFFGVSENMNESPDIQAQTGIFIEAAMKAEQWGIDLNQNENGFITDNPSSWKIRDVIQNWISEGLIQEEDVNLDGIHFILQAFGVNHGTLGFALMEAGLEFSDFLDIAQFINPGNIWGSMDSPMTAIQAEVVMAFTANKLAQSAEFPPLFSEETQWVSRNGTTICPMQINRHRGLSSDAKGIFEISSDVLKDGVRYKVGRVDGKNFQLTAKGNTIELDEHVDLYLSQDQFQIESLIPFEGNLPEEYELTVNFYGEVNWYGVPKVITQYATIPCRVMPEVLVYRHDNAFSFGNEVEVVIENGYFSINHSADEDAPKFFDIIVKVENITNWHEYVTTARLDSIDENQGLANYNFYFGRRIVVPPTGDTINRMVISFHPLEEPRAELSIENSGLGLYTTENTPLHYRYLPSPTAGSSSGGGQR